MHIISNLKIILAVPLASTQIHPHQGPVQSLSMNYQQDWAYLTTRRASQGIPKNAVIRSTYARLTFLTPFNLITDKSWDGRQPHDWFCFYSIVGQEVISVGRDEMNKKQNEPHRIIPNQFQIRENSNKSIKSRCGAFQFSISVKWRSLSEFTDL